MHHKDVHRFLSTAARGTEHILDEELAALGATRRVQVPGGVTFTGDFELGMKACLWLRTGNKVNLALGEAKVSSEDDVYDAVRALDLKPWFHPNHTISVRAHTNDPAFRNAHYLGLKIKDAVVDSLRERMGHRPSVDTEAPDVEINAHVVDGTARFYLAMHGQPLNQRGYRQERGVAPLKETLAAALILFSKWDGSTPLHDPMCGSGTIPIEAAMIAADMAPGLGRTFGFERWPGYGEGVRQRWLRLQTEARSRRRRVRLSIIGGDFNGKALAAARKNAATAGVTDIVFFKEQDARSVAPLSPPGAIVVNPPYGERMGGSEESIVKLYEVFSGRVRGFTGHTLTMLSTKRLLKRGVHLRPDEHREVYNGALQCEMARYSVGGAAR